MVKPLSHTIVTLKRVTVTVDKEDLMHFDEVSKMEIRQGMLLLWSSSKPKGAPNNIIGVGERTIIYIDEYDRTDDLPM